MSNIDCEDAELKLDAATTTDEAAQGGSTSKEEDLLNAIRVDDIQSLLQLLWT